MYTIFKNDVSIILTDDTNLVEGKQHLLWKDYHAYPASEREMLTGQSTLFIFDEDLSFMWKEFKKDYKIIEASGGIVVNSSKQLLFIFRHGKWDLPKGKIEAGESREDGAQREVREECGITELDLGKYVGTTYHIYPESGEEVLKVSYWYEMFSDNTDLSPQLEEGITELGWMSPDKLEPVLQNTFPNIVVLLDLYHSVCQ